MVHAPLHKVWMLGKSLRADGPVRTLVSSLPGGASVAKLASTAPWQSLRGAAGAAARALPLVDVSIGILRVYQGLQPYDTALSSNIRYAAKDLAVKVDDVLKVYDWVRQGELLQTEQNETLDVSLIFYFFPPFSHA